MRLGSRLERCEKLIPWLRENGAHISEKLAVASFPLMGLGVRCRQPVEQFEVLARIPLKLCFYESLDSVSSSSSSALINDCELRFKLANRLIAESLKGNRSRHAFYLRTLPRSFQSLPLLWREERLKSIEGTSLEMEVSTEKRLLLRKFNSQSNSKRDHHHPHFREEKQQMKRFLWAVGAVKSRMRLLAGHASLIPFLDLLNHTDLYSSPPWGSRGCAIVLDRVQDSESEEQAFHLVALANIASNEQLLIEYSLLSFQSKIQEYGFLDRDSDVRDRYYSLALHNSNDPHNPLLLSVWRKNLPVVIQSLVEEDGLDELTIRRMLEERLLVLRHCSNLAQKAMRQSEGMDRDCRFIYETDVFYTQYCLDNLSALLSDRDGIEHCQRTEMEEDAQKMAFMSAFSRHTGLQIEM